MSEFEGEMEKKGEEKKKGRKETREEKVMGGKNYGRKGAKKKGGK